ncbi:MAG: hypothetical protein IT304_11525 [Dehalococcoidia bacterium]|nr:hypothetical protein [Dehalococcoidia bacterium]
MPGGTSGLRRDIDLVRRRAWLFIPFALIGIVIALAFGSFAGKANAVATMQLETVVQTLVNGGDRGLRIFEAQSMTSDARFKKQVVEATGDPTFDYARFVVSLSPISVADGVSRGALTVSIKDDDKAKAEQYRQAWVDVFTREYTAQDGLFRTRFLDKKQEVANLAEQRYQEGYTQLAALLAGKGPPIDELLRRPAGTSSSTSSGMIGELNVQIAAVTREAAEVEAALAAGGTVSGATASAILGQPVADGDARAALEARRAILAKTSTTLIGQRDSLSDSALSPEVRALVDNVRALQDTRAFSYNSLNDARVAVTSAQSDVDTAYSFSGGVAGTAVGRVAVAVAVTVVFGLIAIYLLEWLGQVRGATPDTA